MRTKALAVAAYALMVGGLACIAVTFHGDWDRIGVLAVIVGGQAGIAAYFAGKRGTLDDAFEAGYQAGFHRGERVKPKVIQIPIERRRAPALRRSQEPS